MKSSYRKPEIVEQGRVEDLTLDQALESNRQEEAEQMFWGDFFKPMAADIQAEGEPLDVV